MKQLDRWVVDGVPLMLNMDNNAPTLGCGIGRVPDSMTWVEDIRGMVIAGREFSLPIPFYAKVKHWAGRAGVKLRVTVEVLGPDYERQFADGG